ncbi:MAG: PrsW family glutamic-type intramembrane protease [Candidatus Peregrinibacteria bacterium]
MTFLFAFFTAALPVAFWYVIIIRKKRRGMNFFFWLTFIFAAIFAVGFKYYEPSLGKFLRHDIALNILASYIILGVLIEYGKNIIVRLVGGHYFQGIDDVIDLSFATALGFTFAENTIHFYSLFLQPLDYGTPIAVFKEILSREFFILPIHLFCSGIFGYFYGVSIFATSSMEEQETQKGFAGWEFRTMSLLKGTIISTVTYGVFFMLNEIDPSISDILKLMGVANFPLNEKIMPIISFGFFSIGTVYLFQLMEKKQFLIRQKQIQNTPKLK